MFSIFPIIFGIIFLLSFGLVIFVIFRSIRQENKNNHSPRLRVEAKVVSKRAHSPRGTEDPMGHTTYYVTFEVESGDRMELKLSAQEYAMLVEGDFGDLTFQGTRYLSYQRKMPSYDV